MTSENHTSKETLWRSAGDPMLRSRALIGLAIAAALLAAAIGFALAPGALEQGAMEQRTALEQAEQIYAEQGPREALAALDQAHAGDKPAIARAQLRYAAEAGLIDRHYAILSDPTPSSASNSRAICSPSCRP